MQPPPTFAAPVLLFDGECGLCQRIVQVLLRWDRRAQLRFAPLQGAAAQDFLRQRGLPLQDFDSLIFVADWSQRHDSAYDQRTDGVIAALRQVGGAGPSIAGLLAILPSGARDAGYRCVARWRHRVFGPSRPPALIRPDWPGRFLD